MLGILSLRSRIPAAIRPLIRCLSVSAVKLQKESEVERWDKLENTFYGPERDHKNFPMLKIRETSPPVRLGFIPESFFQFFYEKTGVTGPYLFGAGVLTVLLSKEIWVVDHEFGEILSVWAAFLFLFYKVGPMLRDYTLKESKETLEKEWLKPIQQLRRYGDVMSEKMERYLWEQEGKKYLFEAKKENALLQLEAMYRERLQNVHQQVKQRLDYQIDIQNVKRRFEQEHMVNWITRNVIANITPQQEKESIAKCISDLQSLSAAQ